MKREGHYVRLGPLDAEVAKVAAAVGVEPGQVLAAILRRHLAAGRVGDAYAEAVHGQLALLAPRPSEVPRAADLPEAVEVARGVETEPYDGATALANPPRWGEGV